MTASGGLLPESPVNSRPLTVPTNTELATSMANVEKQLLANILALMRPVIATCFSLSDEYVQRSSDDSTKDSVMGKDLISALKEFIGAEVVSAAKYAAEKRNTISKGAPSKIVETGTEGFKYSADFNSLTERPMNTMDPGTLTKTILSGPSPTELETMILTETRAHVFNRMPVRMLAFNSAGSNIELIERDQIFRRILPHVHKTTQMPQFQQDWNKAISLRDYSFFIRHRSKRMHELITSAIRGCAFYAILSHTWIRESPGDIVFSTWDTRSSNPTGYAKVENFCYTAAHSHSMTLGWLDTVCINKDSSSELDESIRSMFKWYLGSHVCITYLSETETIGDGSHDSWFTRGWTLQELLAPKCSFFYNKDWNFLGTLEDSKIRMLIEAETTITNQELIVCQNNNIETIPPSRILQMASQRQVTREEDSAYSLLGLMNVNMPVAYGEGARRAFQRLFQELLNARKNVLDLFNRQYHYNDSLTPPSLQRYSTRIVEFDRSTSGTNLDNYQPRDPIILTHFGIRCDWLLLPSFCFARDSNKMYQPLGNFYGQYPTHVILESGMRVGCVFKLLDKRLYDTSDEAVFRPFHNGLTRREMLQTFAVPTFNVTNDTVILPQMLMAIRIYTPDRAGTVNSNSKVGIMSRSKPYYFELGSIDGSRNIHINDLKSHGMQLVTLHL